MSMPEQTRPPIPATCEHRPTTGGLVNPWGNVELGDGGCDFRSQHESRIQRCWWESLCQLCGRSLTRPMVLFGGPRQVRALEFDEPPLHLECAVYASQACPMVAGRLDRYADRDVVANGHRGDTCPDPECNCGGWVPTPGVTPAPGGDPAHDWYAVYVSGYQLGVAVDRPGRVAGGVLMRDQVLAVRHVSKPGVGRTWKRTTLDEVAGRA